MRKIIPALVLLAVSALCRPALCQDRIAWQSDLRQAQQVATQRSQLMLLHFWGENCGPCLRLEHYVFNRPEVIRAMGTNYVAVKINVNERPDVADRFKITSMPVDVIVTPEGKEIYRAVSPQNPNQYIAQLDQVAASFRSGITPGSPLTGSPTVPGGDLAAAGTSTNPSGSFQVAANPAANSALAGSASRRNSDFVTPESGFSANPAAPTNVPAPGTAGRSPPMSPNFMSNPYNGSPATSAPAGSSARPGTAVPPPARSASHMPTAPAAHGQMPPATTSQGGNAAAYRSHTQPASFNLPPGSPPLIMDGYCPVSLIEGNEWKPGLAQCGAIHRGRTYLFASPAEQQKFLAAPDRYSPVLSGLDSVRFLEMGQFTEGKREFGVSFNDQIFLFADAEGRDRFESNPFHYARVANEAMRISDQGKR